MTLPEQGDRRSTLGERSRDMTGTGRMSQPSNTEQRNLSRPIDCPDCDSPIVWTGDRTGVCACNGTYPDDQAEADRLAFRSRREFGDTYAQSNIDGRVAQVLAELAIEVLDNERVATDVDEWDESDPRCYLYNAATAVIEGHPRDALDYETRVYPCAMCGTAGTCVGGCRS